jgi:hypothetical protein
MLLAALSLLLAADSPVIQNEPALVFGRVSNAVLVVKCDVPGGKSQGSAVVIAKDTAVTNFHVVKGAKKITVTQGGTTVDATLLRFDEKRDVALLTFTGLDRRPVAVASVKTVKVGDKVYAVGAPHGLELTLSDGLVSSLREGAKGEAPTIQTTAPISPGSSGGGLFDGRGRLVGITTFQTSGQNLNFARPSDWVTELLQGKDAKPSEAPPAPAWTVTSRPKNVSCTMEERATWGLFADGPELLESQPYKGTLSFFGFDGQTPMRGETELVLRDMSRKSSYVSFAGRDPSEQYFFTFDDDGSIRLIKAEAMNFKGQLRLVTRSGGCTEVEKRVAEGKEIRPVTATEEEQCVNGDAHVCMALASGLEGGLALVYYRRACESGETDGCAKAADLYDGVGDKTKAAKYRAMTKALPSTPAKAEPAKPAAAPASDKRRPLPAGR